MSTVLRPLLGYGAVTAVGAVDADSVANAYDGSTAHCVDTVQSLGCDGSADRDHDHCRKLLRLAHDNERGASASAQTFHRPLVYYEDAPALCRALATLTGSEGRDSKVCVCVCAWDEPITGVVNVLQHNGSVCAQPMCAPCFFCRLPMLLFNYIIQ